MKKNTLNLTICFFLIFISGCIANRKKLDKVNKEHQQIIEQLIIEDSLKIVVLNSEIQELTKSLNSYDSLIKSSEKISTEDKIKIEQITTKLTKTYNKLSELEKNQNEKYKIIERVVYKDSSKIIYPQTNPNKIAFYCPEVMMEENTYEITAMIGYLFEEKEIKNELLNVVNEVRKERDETPLTIKDIVSKDVFLGRYLKIKLLDPANKFSIIIPDNYPKEDSIVKIYDDNANKYFNKQFTWKWLVTPKPNKRGQASLKIIITPYDKNMRPQYGKERDFKIDIILRQSFLSSMWEHANRNPEWALAGIITPILTFLAGFLVKRKKKDSTTNDDGENV